MPHQKPILTYGPLQDRIAMYAGKEVAIAVRQYPDDWSEVRRQIAIAAIRYYVYGEWNVLFNLAQTDHASMERIVGLLDYQQLVIHQALARARWLEQIDPELS